MIAKHIRIALPAVALILIGAPASADEPGPGGFKSKPPVSGEEVYKAVCQACHMADAKGLVNLVV